MNGEQDADFAPGRAWYSVKRWPEVQVTFLVGRVCDQLDLSLVYELLVMQWKPYRLLRTAKQTLSCKHRRLPRTAMRTGGDTSERDGSVERTCPPTPIAPVHGSMPRSGRLGSNVLPPYPPPPAPTHLLGRLQNRCCWLGWSWWWASARARPNSRILVATLPYWRCCWWCHSTAEELAIFHTLVIRPVCAIQFWTLTSYHRADGGEFAIWMGFNLFKCNFKRQIHLPEF